MNDLVYLNMFRDAQTRPMVLHYFLERKYGIETLIKYAGSKEAYPLPDYSSWVISHLAKEFPEQTIDHQPLMIDAFFDSTNQSVLRNLLVAMIKFPLSEHREGEFYDKLISHLLDSNNLVALHVNCIYKLMQFAEKYPELINEIANSIEIRLESNKQASLVAASKKFYKKFKRTN